MAIAIVAVTKIQSAGGASASASVSATAGNTLIVAGAMFGSPTWTVTRTGDTYTSDTAGDPNSSGVGIASAPNVAGGAVSMTVACTSATGITAYAIELSGLPTSAIRDATSPAVASASSTSAASGSLTNATANAIYIGVVSTLDSSNPTTFTPTGSWSDSFSGTTAKEPNNSTAEGVDIVFQIVSSASARTATWTVASNFWSVAIAVYKASATVAQIPYNPWMQRAPMLAQ